MARRFCVRLLSAGGLVVLLSGCGASGTTVDPADAAAASAVGQDRSTAATTTTTTADGASSAAGSQENQPSSSAPPRGNPGAPGGSRDDAGGTDVQAGGNPGAPGDVAVFEEAGVPHGVLRTDAATTCAGGVCTLLEPVVTAGNPDDLGGVDECLIRARSDIRYDPPAQGGLFQKGATVQAHVDCTAPDSGTGGTTGTDPGNGGTTGTDPGTGGTTGGAGTSAGASSADATRSTEPQE